MTNNFAIKTHWLDIQLKITYWILSYLATFGLLYYHKVTILFYISKSLLLLNKKFIFTQVTTAFWIYFQLCNFVSLVFLLPLLNYFFFFFLLKSFYNYQIKILFSLFSLFYIFLTSLIHFFVSYLFPGFLQFFLNFENLRGIVILQLEARIDQYFYLYIYLFIFLLLLLVIPLFFLGFKYFLMNRIKIFYLRKYLYSLLFFCFVLLAPPDLTTQLLLFPFLILFTEFLFFCFALLNSLFHFIIDESRIRTYDE